jgi:hypothetical protein
MARASPSLGDDLSVGSSSVDDDDSDNRNRQGQSSVMGSISGAFGLLSRRNPSPVHAFTPREKSIIDVDVISSFGHQQLVSSEWILPEDKNMLVKIHPSTSCRRCLLNQLPTECT